MWSSFSTKLSIFGSINYEPFPHFLIFVQDTCKIARIRAWKLPHLNSDSLQQKVVCSDDYHPVEGFVSTDNSWPALCLALPKMVPR